jgi:hypothetical protein
LDGSLPLRLLYLLIEEDVDAQRIHVGIGNGLMRRRARERMEEIGRPLGETAQLAR